ncbi:MAG: hypothetical protein SFY56_15170 [Bacteroidota bacterium]|nr:hypothetical protein [Bacteroidota bacterium]
MKYIFFILIIIATSTRLFGQTKANKKSKTIIDEDCTSQGYVINDDLPITDKEFTKYLASRHPKNFPRGTVEIDVVFHADSSICFNRVVIRDSTKTPKVDVDRIKLAIKNYGDFGKIKFHEKENSKTLTILIYQDKKGNLTTGFLPVFLDKRTLH